MAGRQALAQKKVAHPVKLLELINWTRIVVFTVGYMRVNQDIVAIQRIAPMEK